MPSPQSTSFTTVGVGGLLNVLKNRCGITHAFIPGQGQTPPQPVEFDAIWDTGATNSVITQAVVDACRLMPIGMTQVHAVNSTDISEIYLVNIHLPNNVAFVGMRVTKGKLPGNESGILIGMDIINSGDFAVTNKNGITKFSFRVPSEADIDFVQEHNRALLKTSHGGSKNKRNKKPKKHGKNKKRK